MPTDAAPVTPSEPSPSRRKGGSAGQAVPTLDPVAAHRWLSRRPPSSPWLHDEVGTRMAERLGWIQTPPDSWLDWNPLLGGRQAHQAVVDRYPNSKRYWRTELDRQAMNASVSGVSTLRRMWQRVAGAADAAGPLWTEGTGVGLLWANMLLHTVHEPEACFRQWLDCLRVDGFLMFSALGPDSLQELRRVYGEHGWPAPCHAFTDMHDWGDMLVSAGFADPVMDVERWVLTYPTAERLLDELRSIGRNLGVDRSTVTRGRAWRGHWLRLVEAQWPRDANGQLTLTVEVVYGHAYRGRPKPRVADETRVSVTDMRQMLGHRGRLKPGT